MTLNGIEKINPDGSLQAKFTKAIGAEFVHLMDDLLGPRMDWRKMDASRSELQQTSDLMFTKMMPAYSDGNLDLFESLYSEAHLRLTRLIGVPPFISQQFRFSFEETVKMNRAFLASLTCMALHDEYPVVLIHRAYRGDRRAVLDLLRADSLFMHDSCCVDVIRQAELQNDHRFLEQLKKAVGRKTLLRRRDVMHFYCYVLIVLEQFGFSTPTHKEVWTAIDPHGREYESLGAFERDFRRRRSDLIEMLGTAIPVRWPESVVQTDLGDGLQGLA